MDKRIHRNLAVGIGRDIVSVLLCIDSDGAHVTLELFAESSKNNRNASRIGYFDEKSLPFSVPSRLPRQR